MTYLLLSQKIYNDLWKVYKSCAILQSTNTYENSKKPWTINKCDKPCIITEYNRPWTINKCGKSLTINECDRPWTINKCAKPLTIDKWNRPWTINKCDDPWIINRCGRPWTINGCDRPWTINKCDRLTLWTINKCDEPLTINKCDRQWTINKSCGQSNEEISSVWNNLFITTSVLTKLLWMSTILQYDLFLLQHVSLGSMEKPPLPLLWHWTPWHTQKVNFMKSLVSKTPLAQLFKT